MSVRTQRTQTPTKASATVGPGRKRKIWLYMVDGRNNHDLAQLDAHGFETWRGNPDTRAGDLVILYRTAPYSDIAYVFVARSDARPTPVTRRWPWKYAVDLADGYRLQRVVTLAELKEERSLRGWNFLTMQRGATSRRQDLQQQGVWQHLRRILESRAPGIVEHFGPAWTGTGRRRTVFLSYASQDSRKVQNLYISLSRAGIDVWMDHHELAAGDDFEQNLARAIRSSDAVVVCLSHAWARRRGFVKRELQMVFDEERRRRPSTRRFLFPVLIEKVRVPKPLESLHVVDLGGDDRARKVAAFVRTLRRSTQRTKKTVRNTARSSSRRSKAH